MLEAFRDDRSEMCIAAREFKHKKPPDRQVVLVKVDRCCNKVAHELCQFSRREWCSGVLLSAIPTCARRNRLGMIVVKTLLLN
jgi:hypothetical protein